MKALTIPDAEAVILGLQDEIRRSDQSRYDHRLHGVLLVAQGLKCPEVARLLGDAPRTVEYWVRRFLEDGLGGLTEMERPGRPPRLRPEHLREIGAVLRGTPEGVGLTGNVWDGKTLAEFAARQYGATLGVRQCQRLFHQLGFRLRKPRPVIARADPEVQARHKKNSES